MWFRRCLTACATMSWIYHVLGLPWLILPKCLKLRVWRIFESCNSCPPPLSLPLVNFPHATKVRPWEVREASGFRAYLASLSRDSYSEMAERVLRLVEIKKGGFFAKKSSEAMLMLALGFAEYGSRLGDLRYTNTALKLRDWAVASRPPISSIQRLLFTCAEKEIYKAVHLLDK